MSRWLGIFALALLLPPAPANAIKGKPQVIDGDTIVIAGERIHLFGIDAPESGQSCMAGQRTWQCGQNATFALAGIIGTHWVLCRERGRDRHGDMLGVCHIAGYRGPDINAQLVAAGWALADRRRSLDYVDEEARASAEGRGIWASRFTVPWEWRRQNQPQE